MALFGIKKKGEVKEATDIIKELEKEEHVLGRPPDPPVPAEQAMAEQQRQQEFAPLFVRIDKYRQILQTMNFLKTTMGAMRSSLSILRELDRLRDENLKMVEGAVSKVEQRMMALDSNFMRPSGFVEDVPELRDVEGVELTLEDLRTQIEQLKAQIETFA